ncbi:hypothetical protein [uncultured Corynebacterium sp.]|uniref:hypothetical protein n=1 Tax=uncultured Corynebacterium sp. TaxID=159447 RepID=UPI00262B8398|nr:hypothetical protein [uncultured Corynebacterium sp.]
MKPQRNAKHGYCRKHAKTENAANTYHPSGPTITRLHTLLAAGWSCAAIADTVGISIYSVYNLRDGKRSTVRKTTADGIARINPHTRTGASWVPAWPTQRRLHALQAAGWTQTEIATNTGLAQALISKISTGRVNITHPTAQAINTLWDQVAHQPVAGPPTPLAKRRKWATPMEWDNIDNPNEHHPPAGNKRKWQHTEISYPRLKDIADGTTARTSNEIIDFIYLESDRERGRQAKAAKQAKSVRHAA